MPRLFVSGFQKEPPGVSVSGEGYQIADRPPRGREPPRRRDSG